MRVIASALFVVSSSAFAADLSFSQALREMVEKDVDVQVQETQVRAAGLKVSAAKGAFSPQFNVQAESIGNGGNQISTFGSVTVPNYDIFLANATWNVFRSGADVAALRAAYATSESQNATLAADVIKAEDTCAQALLNMIESKLAVDVIGRSELSSQHFLDIAEKRFAKSLLSREELDKVATDASNVEARRADAELRYFNARQVVESLLGHSNVQIKWPLEFQLQPDEIAELLAKTALDAKAGRPDLLAAQANLSSQDLQSRQLWRGLLPTVDLSFTNSSQFYNGLSQNGWQGMATLTIPLWNGLRDYSTYRVQLETQNAAEFELRQLERTIDSVTKLAQDGYRLSYDQYTRRKQNLVRAQHILDQDEARFRIGRSDANELNLDLARVTEAELLAVQGMQQVHVAYVALYHAFGRRIPESLE